MNREVKQGGGVEHNGSNSATPAFGESRVLASRSKHFETGIVVSLVGAVYALAQIYIYQNGLFVPFLQMSHAATVFLITWRILFLAAYWLIILAAAGIQLAWARILTVVSTAAGLIATINSLIGNIKKH